MKGTTKQMMVDVVDLALNEKSSTASGTVKINGKEKGVMVRSEYDRSYSKKITEVVVDGLTPETLNDLGIELDTSKVTEKYKQLLKEKEDERVKEQQKKMADLYQNSRLHEVKKLLSEEGIETKFNTTKAEYIKERSSRNDLWLTYEEEYKKCKIHYSITDEDLYSGSWSYRRPTGQRFEIRDREDYSEKDVRRKNPSGVVKKFKEMLEGKKVVIDAKIKSNKKRAEEFATVREKYGDDVQKDSLWHSGSRPGRGYTTSCYKVEKTKKDSYRSNSVQFTIDREGLANIKNLDLDLNEEQLKTVLDWVRKSKVS